MFIESWSWREVANYHAQDKDHYHAQEKNHEHDKNTYSHAIIILPVIYYIAGKDQTEEDEGCTSPSAGILSR